MDRSEAGRLGYEKASVALVAYNKKKSADANARWSGKTCAADGCENLLSYEQRRGRFCSLPCAARTNNGLRLPVRTIPCPGCAQPMSAKRRRRGQQQATCSRRCSAIQRMERSIADWLAGKIPGGSWHGAAPFVKRWLITKYGEKCSRCGWCEIHPITGKVPVQVDHADGDPYNHAPENLRLLCPNCHSLTPTFGALNKGKGRSERQLRHQRLSGEAPSS